MSTTRLAGLWQLQGHRVSTERKKCLLKLEIVLVVINGTSFDCCSPSVNAMSMQSPGLKFLVVGIPKMELHTPYITAL